MARKDRGGGKIVWGRRVKVRWGEAGMCNREVRICRVGGDKHGNYV